MKTIKTSMALMLLFMATTLSAQSPDSWLEKSDFPGKGRANAVGFNIGGKIYIATGYDGVNALDDVWEYNPATDTWIQKGNFPGDARYSAIGFSIGNKGYLGQGASPAVHDDFWEYDPATDIWTQKHFIPGGGQSSAVGFSIGDYGYVGIGSSSTPAFHRYDPVSDNWETIATFPGTARLYASSFVINGKAYVGCGASPNYTFFHRAFYEFDPATNLFTAIDSLPGEGRYVANGMSIESKGYIGGGYNTTGLADFWEYDPATSGWTERTSLAVPNSSAVAVGVGCKGYLINGADGTWSKKVLEYIPLDIPVFYADTDGDGFGSNAIVYACHQPLGTSTNSDDCDDTNVAIHPAATEICNNNVDDDCNGLADDADPWVIGQGTYFTDLDGDGFGAGTAIIACVQPLNTSLNNDDCDDAASVINPSAQEVCNGLDDNCTGEADEGLIFTAYFKDADADGFGEVSDDGILLCNDPGAGYSIVAEDCNDEDALINPSSIEVCLNNVDDNCNGQTDEGCAECDIPDSLVTVSLTDTKAKLQWSYQGTPEIFKVYYKKADDSSWNFKMVFGNSTQTKLNNLVPATQYKWFVMAVCSQLTELSEMAAFVTASDFNKEAETDLAGITDINSGKRELTVYPNPTDGHFFVEVKGLDQTIEIATVQIISITGALVYTADEKVNNGMLNQEITLPGYCSSGYYFVRIITPPEAVTASFIKQK